MENKIVCEQRTDEGLRTFKDNICGTIRTIDSGGDKRVIEIKQVGNIVNTGNWDNPQRGRIYSSDGLSPSLNTVGGGGLEPKIIEPMIVASRGRNKENPSDRTAGAEVEQRLEPNSQGICNTLTSVQKDNYVLEPAILTPKRTEYGKAIRKDYESGKIQESRHNMTELQPREDGVSNTLTTVQKDNYVLEPTIKIKQATKEGYIECKLGGVADLSYPTSQTRRGRVQDNGDTSPTITAAETGVHKIESPYRISILNHSSKLYNLLFYIDGLCDIIDVMEGDKYEETKRNTNQVLQILWRETGKETLQWKARGFDDIQKENLLQQRVYESRDDEHGGEREQCKQLKNNSEEDKRASNEKYEMQRMWGRWKTRCASQGFRLSEQQYRKFDSFMQKLSYEDTQDKERMCNMWESDESKRILRQALSEIQKIWGSLAHKEKSNLQSMWGTSSGKTIMWETLSRTEKEGAYRIRKLAPIECWRLMGFTDEDFYKAEKVNSNSQLYKQAGNSIVVDVLEAIFKQML